MLYYGSKLSDNISRREPEGYLYSEFGMTQAEGRGVLDHLIRDEDLSLYGLANAVTRYSQDVESYDRASDLESIGYSIMGMSAGLLSRLSRVSAEA